MAGVCLYLGGGGWGGGSGVSTYRHVEKENDHAGNWPEGNFVEMIGPIDTLYVMKVRKMFRALSYIHSTVHLSC